MRGIVGDFDRAISRAERGEHPSPALLRIGRAGTCSRVRRAVSAGRRPARVPVTRPAGGPADTQSGEEQLSRQGWSSTSVRSPTLRALGIRAFARPPGEGRGRLRPAARRRPRADRAHAERARAAPADDARDAPYSIDVRSANRTGWSSTSPPSSPPARDERRAGLGRVRAGERDPRFAGPPCAPGERVEERSSTSGCSTRTRSRSRSLRLPAGPTPGSATSSPTRGCSSTCRYRSPSASASARSSSSATR
jgi:hypothetical protein